MTPISAAGFVRSSTTTQRSAPAQPVWREPLYTLGDDVFQVGSGPQAAPATPPDSASKFRTKAAVIALGVAFTLAPAILVHHVRSVVQNAQAAPVSISQTAAPSSQTAPPAAQARPAVPVTLQEEAAVPLTAPPAQAPAKTTHARPAQAPSHSNASASRGASTRTSATSAKSDQGVSDRKPTQAPIADDTILTHIGKDTHVVADKTVDAGKAVWHPIKKAGLGIGHFFGKGGHQLKEGWNSKDQ